MHGPDPSAGEPWWQELKEVGLGLLLVAVPTALLSGCLALIESGR